MIDGQETIFHWILSSLANHSLLAQTLFLLPYLLKYPLAHTYILTM
jgi:hypothetical protein